MKRHRAILACGAMIWAASLSLYAASYIAGISDFAQIWTGARALLAQQNPYDAVGPRRTLNWSFPLFYPFTAVLVGVPFAWLPLWLANASFAAVGAGLLAWGLTQERLNDPRLLVFLSLPFAYACIVSQWSPLLVGATLVTPFGWLLACKPTIGLPLLVWRPTWTRVVLVGVFGLISLTLWPAWPAVWLETIAKAPHITPPVMLPFGWLLLAPLVFWRYPPTWFVVLMACLPQAPLLYEAVVLFLVIRTWGEAAFFWATTITAWRFVPVDAPSGDQYQALASLAPKMLWGAYLPAALIVLRQGWHDSKQQQPAVRHMPETS